MILRIILFAMMALGLGGFGMIAWVSTRPAPLPIVAASTPQIEAPAPAPPATVHVLVAARSIRAGSLLKPEEITAREVPKDNQPAGSTLDTPENRVSLVGAMVRRPVGQSEPLVAVDLMRPGDHGFLAAVLQPGMRAVTIGVDMVSGTAGLIWPGDRVDVIMTRSIEDPRVPMGRRVYAKTVQKNARVIAIDQQLVQGAVPGGAEGNAARTVTIEVDGKQAQEIQVAAKIAKLSLAVRSSETGTPASDEDAGAVFASDLSPDPTDEPRKPVSDNTLRIHNGTGESKEFKF